MSNLTIVIPLWNSGQWLAHCLNGLMGQTYQNFTILLVDNGSTDRTIPFLQRYYPHLPLLKFPTNRGFSAAVNAGISHAQTEYVALLNVDTYAEPTWLAHLVARLEHSPPQVGSVACQMRLMQAPTRIDTAGDSLSWYGSTRKRGHLEEATQYDEAVEILSPCAGAALYRRALFDEIGLFDEDFTSYLEDVDWGMRAQLMGYRAMYEPRAVVYHYGHSAGVVGGRYVRLMTRNRLTMLMKTIPTRQALRHILPLLYGQWYYLLVYKKPFHSLQGYAQFLQQLPHTWRKRQQIQRQRVISEEALEPLLSSELGEPALTEIVRHRVSRWLKTW